MQWTQPLITHFVNLEKEKQYDIETLSIDGVLSKEHLLENHSKNGHQRLVPDPFLILLNNSKQPLHEKIRIRLSFKNKNKIF